MVAASGEQFLEGAWRIPYLISILLVAVGVWIRLKVDETDVARISVGDSAIVQIDAFPDTTFTGRVVQISNSSVRGAAAAPSGDQAIDYEVTIELLNAPAETRPGPDGTVEGAAQRHDALTSRPKVVR